MVKDDGESRFDSVGYVVKFLIIMVIIIRQKIMGIQDLDEAAPFLGNELDHLLQISKEGLLVRFDLAEMDSTSDSTQHNTPDQNYC